MIRSPSIIIPELITKFKVKKVTYEPYAESNWHLSYKENFTFLALDQLFETTESDENLTNKEVQAQIDVSRCEIKPTVVKRKLVLAEGNLITATGIFRDKIQRKGFNEEYWIDSIFPLNVSICNNEKLDIKKGDWITVQGEAYIILPRGCNIR